MPVRIALSLVLATSCYGFARGLLARESGVVLEKLRLDPEGKVQVDVVVRSGPPPDKGRVDVELTDSRGAEVVAVVGLNGVKVRRIATATRPLACGKSERVTASVTSPEAKGSVLKRTLKRACDAPR